MRTLPAFLLMLAAAARAGAAEPSDQAGIDFFETRIRPIFVEHCYECHSNRAEPVEGGLRLDTAAAIRKGGESGPIVTAGSPDESPLIASVSYAADGVNMPPDGRLNARTVADLRKWVTLGAPLPQADDEGAAAPPKPVVIDDRARDFWSFRPLAMHDAPTVSDPAWPRTKIDRFVLGELDRRQLRPAPEADRRTLIRRLSFDLTGLPPTIAEVEAFAASKDPLAYEKLVDRLLESARYGERWARHWLDVVRYGENNPTNESTCPTQRFAYRYRDWVVRALNDDLPYDEFVRRQLAADLIPGLPPAELAATGLLGLSPVYHKEPKLSAEVIAPIVADEWDERIDTITRGLLGLTVACARCHDHKFDPIRTEDYYALAGVMASTRLVERPLADVPLAKALELQNTREAVIDVELRLSYAKTMGRTAKAAGEPTGPFDERVKKLEAELKAVKERKLFDGPIADGVCDAAISIDGRDPAWTSIEFRTGEGRDLPVFLRGNPARPGPIVSRRFIEVLSRGAPRPFGHGSGRLELADAIVGDASGLTARVIVNRVWAWHFGRPLVRTPSNFGALGDRPSHPELLDDLAARFVAAGWSLKWLHREIVSSASYRQSSVHPNAGGADDPALVDGDNRLLWRMNRRRLEPEAWRDAVLFVAGQLDETAGGPSAELDDAKNVRRTIYGRVNRQGAADVLRLFDFPDAKQHAEERMATTTPLQQLYLLNSPFVRQNAEALGDLDDGSPTSEARLRALFRRVLGRGPTPDERRAARRLLDDGASAGQSSPGPLSAGASSEGASSDGDAWRLIAHGLLMSNEFLHVD